MSMIEKQTQTAGASLEKALFHLLRNDPFYAHITVQLDKVFTDRVAVVGLGTSGKHTNLALWINPETFPRLTTQEQIALIKHNLHHLVFKHPLRQSNHAKDRWWFSTDIAINPMVHRMPDTARMTEIMGVPYFVPFPSDMGFPDEKVAEWYYRDLPDVGVDGGAESDDHAGWSEISEDMGESMAEKAIKDVVRNATSRAAGNVPGNLKEYIDKLLYSDVRWESQLREFLARSRRANRRYTMKKRSRRIKSPLAQGVTKERKLKVLVAQDTSGSTYDYLPLFFGELDKILDVIKSEVTLVEVDTEIQSVRQYKKGMRPEVHGLGGTDLRPIFDWVKEQKEDWDCLIYFTDTFGPGPTVETIPTLWAITENGWHNKDDFCSFGKKIKIEHRKDN